jgi:multimeric flavodoxin WrbA
MSSLVVAFSSSPRRRSNSDTLADHILRGAVGQGATAEKVRLHGLNLRPCQGCDACQASVEAPCVIADDMAGLLAHVRRADALVLASPIYFATVNAQMKLFLDRLYALFGGGTFDVLRGKRLALAFTYAGDPFESGTINALRMFQDAAFGLGLTLVGWVHARCLAPGEIEADRPALDAAVALGAKLARP